MICKAEGIDEVTEILSDLIVIITIGRVTTTVFGYLFGVKVLDFGNWVSELSLQIYRWLCVCYPLLP